MLLQAHHAKFTQAAVGNRMRQHKDAEVGRVGARHLRETQGSDRGLGKCQAAKEVGGVRSSSWGGACRVKGPEVHLTRASNASTRTTHAGNTQGM